MKAVTQDLKGPKSESVQPTTKQADRKEKASQFSQEPTELLFLSSWQKKTQKTKNQSAVFQARLFHIRKELIKISAN